MCRFFLQVVRCSHRGCCLFLFSLFSPHQKVVPSAHSGNISLSVLPCYNLPDALPWSRAICAQERCTLIGEKTKHLKETQTSSTSRRHQRPSGHATEKQARKRKMKNEELRARKRGRKDEVHLCSKGGVSSQPVHRHLEVGNSKHSH